MVLWTDGGTSPALDRDGVARMAALMGEAFMEHQNWKGLIPDPGRRSRALCALFGFMGAVVNRHGHVVVVVEDGREVGYLTFMENRDREQVSFLRVVLCGGLPAALRFLAALRPRELAGMAAFGSAVSKDHGPEGAGGGPDPGGLHLFTAAMDPALKGKGIMKRAFAWMEARFAQEGYSSYMLETTDPSNLPVYMRFGMELSGSAALPGQGRQVWFFRKALGDRPQAS
jgi:GNAT superfamily N-acetyltransferase